MENDRLVGLEIVCVCETCLFGDLWLQPDKEVGTCTFFPLMMRVLNRDAQGILEIRKVQALSLRGHWCKHWQPSELSNELPEYMKHSHLKIEKPIYPNETPGRENSDV